MHKIDWFHIFHIICESISEYDVFYKISSTRDSEIIFEDILSESFLYSPDFNNSLNLFTKSILISGSDWTILSSFRNCPPPSPLLPPTIDKLGSLILLLPSFVRLRLPELVFSSFDSVTFFEIAKFPTPLQFYLFQFQQWW